MEMNKKKKQKEQKTKKSKQTKVEIFTIFFFDRIMGDVQDSGDYYIQLKQMLRGSLKKYCSSVTQCKALIDDTHPIHNFFHALGQLLGFLVGRPCLIIYLPLHKLVQGFSNHWLTGKNARESKKRGGTP